MEIFEEKHLNLKTPMNLRDLMDGGLSFSIDTGEEQENENPPNVFELDFMDFPGVENHLNPIDQSFDEHKMHMEEVLDGVWKRVLKAAPPNAKSVDFSRNRITYHRDFYHEGDTAPFDSTYLNSKPDIICNDSDEKLPGLIEALSTMKEGEKAQFIITYKKMFLANGCVPRVQRAADILAQLEVVKIGEIGDEKSVSKIYKNLSEIKSFEEAKVLTKEARLRAKDHFESGNIKAAIRIFQKIFQMLEFVKVDEGETDERDELSIQILTNLATCFNIQDKPDKTIEMIRQIEGKCSIDNQPKILFAKGKALRMQGEFKEALITLKKAQFIRPNDELISKELEKLDVCVTDYNDVSKKLASKLFM